MLEAAAVWTARLREPVSDPATTAARQAAFEGWFAADHRHRQAYEEMATLWQNLDAPVAQVMAQTRDPSAHRRRCSRRRVDLTRWTVGLAVVIAISVMLFDELRLQLESDYRTAVGQRKTQTLADGSRITLNTDSAIAVEIGPQRRQIHLLQGEAWFEVTPDSARPFVVDTMAGLIRVTGTHFGVRLRDDAAIVSLTEGHVKLSAADQSDDSAALALNPGQQARLSPLGVSSPSAFDPTATMAWLRGQLVFFNTPLRQVIAELNRYRSGYIVIINEDLNALKISGVFATDDLNVALTALAATLPIRVMRLTDYLVLLH
jgi:transmembrane sensor